MTCWRPASKEHRYRWRRDGCASHIANWIRSCRCHTGRTIDTSGGYAVGIDPGLRDLGLAPRASAYNGPLSTFADIRLAYTSGRGSSDSRSQ